MPFIPDSDIGARKNSRASIGSSRFMPDREQVDLVAMEEKAPSVGSRLKSAVQDTASKFTQSVNRAASIVPNVAQDLYKRGETVRQEIGKIEEQPTVAGKVAQAGSALGRTAGEAALGVGDMFMRFFQSANLTDEDKQAIINSKPIQDISNAFKRENLNPEVVAKFDQIKAAADANPEVSKALGDFIAVITLGGGSRAAKAGEEAVAGATKAVAEGVETLGARTGRAVAEASMKVDEALTSRARQSAVAATQAQAGQDLTKIADIITPKPTAREAKLATEQGRLYKGKEPTTFSSGVPDRVALSEQQAKSARTVYDRIKGAADMDEPTLYASIKEEIGTISNQVRPVLEKTPVTEEVAQKMVDNTNALLKAQRENAFIPDNVNLKRFQKDFLERLKRTKGGTANDLWDARQAYDDAVPDAVKKASEISSESLQAYKDLWLENRRVFTDAINELADSAMIGDEGGVKDLFSQMRDLYEANNAILTKAAIEGGKAAPSKAAQFVKTKAGAIATGVAGTAGLGWLLK